MYVRMLNSVTNGTYIILEWYVTNFLGGQSVLGERTGDVLGTRVVAMYIRTCTTLIKPVSYSLSFVGYVDHASWIYPTDSDKINVTMTSSDKSLITWFTI